MPDQRPPDWAPEPPPDWPPPPPDGFDAPAPESAPPPAPSGTPAPRPGIHPQPTTSPRDPQPERPREHPAEPAPLGPHERPVDSYVAPTPPQRASGRRRHGCLIAILVLAGILILGVGGCFLACGDLFEDSYKIGVWGWEDGEGPRLEPGPTTRFGAAPQPQDSAAPDEIKDAEAQKALVAIHRGLLALEKAEGSPYDSSRDGSWERALQPYVDPWPANPWTGEPMHEGLHRGDVQFPGWSDELDLTVYVSP